MAAGPMNAAGANWGAAGVSQVRSETRYVREHQSSRRHPWLTVRSSMASHPVQYTRRTQAAQKRDAGVFVAQHPPKAARRGSSWLEIAVSRSHALRPALRRRQQRPQGLSASICVWQARRYLAGRVGGQSGRAPGRAAGRAGHVNKPEEGRGGQRRALCTVL